MAVNLLLSYAFHEQTNLREIRKDLVCGLMMIDSGAFTAWSKGRPISLNAYAAYLERWQGCWDHAVTLDVIGDGRASAVNTRKLHARGLPVMPVFTRGDKLEDFDAMVADVGYVCVGGLVGIPVKAQLARVRMLQRRAQDAGGGIHALGIGSLATLRAARPYSSDASSVSGAFRFGTVVYFDGSTIKNVSVTDRAKLARDRDHIRAHGIDLAALARTGRMPGQQAGRQELMQAMSLAYAAADEWLKATGLVPPPLPAHSPGTHLYVSASDVDGDHVASLDGRLHGGPHLYNSAGRTADAVDPVQADKLLHGGPNLYSSVTTKELAGGAVTTDSAVHTGWSPPVWAKYGRNHVCHRKAAAHVP